MFSSGKVRLGAGLLGLVLLGLVLWFATRPGSVVVQGEVSANRVDISPRVSGRVAALHADVGDKVQQGDVIAELSNPELVAALATSEAALGVAKASLVNIETIRPETVTAQKAAVAADQADVDLSRANYERAAMLAKRGNASKASLDEMTRNLQGALRKTEAAQAELALTEQGASKEQRALAQAQVDQASAVVNQQGVDVSELTIHAPISGEVTTRVAELGENFSPGAPLFSLVDMNDLWITFNIREDLLAGLKVGDTIDVDIPAVGAKSVPLNVTLINVQGQYATWRATRATGDFDLRTFEVRAKPAKPIAGLRPGMSVIADWHGRG